MKLRISSRFVLFSAFQLVLMAHAQTFTGRVIGTVVDSQQAAVPNAFLTFRSLEREFERHTMANALGEYAFELVPPGRFVLVAEYSGFAPTTINVEVVVAMSVRVDVILRIRPVQQEVKVL